MTQRVSSLGSRPHLFTRRDFELMLCKSQELPIRDLLPGLSAHTVPFPGLVQALQLRVWPPAPLSGPPLRPGVGIPMRDTVFPT